MSYIIGSFNLCDWGDKSLNNNDSKKSLYRLANIINNEGFDIVAFQEVFGGNWLNNFCSHYLSGEWDSCFGVPKDSSTQEGYAFIWKKSKFSLSETVKNEDNPTIIEEYKIPDIDGVKVKRPPYYIRLSPVSLPAMEVRLINIHMMSSSSGNVSLRKAEYSTLIKSIVQSVLQSESNRPLKNKDFYTFMLGDYNLTLAQLDTMNLFVEYKNRLTPLNNQQKEPTTLSSNKENIRQIYTQNDFDHFSFGDATLHGASVLCERIEAVTKYFGYDGRDEYKEKVSDHVPIKLTIDLKGGR